MQLSGNLNDPRERAIAPATWAIASLCLTMLLSSLGTSIANVGLPTFARAFDASFQDVQWVVLAYLLAITTLIVSVGRLGDIVGRRRLMLGGILVFTAASAVCGAAPTLSVLIAARAAQGLGAAVMMALTLAFVGHAVPKEKTGSAMGLLGTMSAIGTALGPSLGGVLIGGFGWRALFMLNVPLGLLALVLAQRFLPADRPAPQASRAGFDVPGTLLLAVTLAAYALAMTIGRGHFGWFNALVTTVVMATLVVGPFYLSGALALDAARVGLVMSTGPIVAALVGVPAGRLVDRVGSGAASVAALVGMSLGTAMLALLPARYGIAGYIAPLVIVTAGYALFQAANNTAVMTGIAPDQRGVVSGLLNLSRNLGLITGASLMGAVFAFGASTRDVTTATPPAVATGMHLTFAVAVALVIAALVLARRAARRVSDW